MNSSASRVLAAMLLVFSLAAEAKPPSWDQVVAVPAELRERFEQQVLQQSGAGEQRLHSLADFMFDAEGLGLVYDNQYTGTIEETFRSGKGNCLAFTLTFVALAREAGLTVQVQELDHALALFHGEDMVFRAGHVNVMVKVHGRRYTVDFDRDVLITAGTPRRVSDRRSAAHYYNNRGAELLADGDLEQAAEYFAAAIDADPSFIATWSNLGVMHVRRGDYAAAETAYQTALKRDERHIATLSNLVSLYTRLQQPEKIAPLEHQLANARRGDPIYNFVLGLRHEQHGDYSQARDAYQRAIRLHRVEPRFHLGLARAYLGVGDEQRAEVALERALTLSKGDASQTLHDKLKYLRR